MTMSPFFKYHCFCFLRVNFQPHCELIVSILYSIGNKITGDLAKYSITIVSLQEVFHVYLKKKLKTPLLIYFSLYWVIIDFHGLV